MPLMIFCLTRLSHTQTRSSAGNTYSSDYTSNCLNMQCNIINSAVLASSYWTRMKRTDKTRLITTRGLNGKGGNVMNCVGWRGFCTPVSSEKEFLVLASDSEASPSSAELKALLADSKRTELTKKLSEANQQNRFLKRQLQVKEDALVNFKIELASLEIEMQALVNFAEEISNYNIPDGSRKINGKYIQSHLLSQLVAVKTKLEQQVKDVEAAQLREVQLFWRGVAESVQVMGSFDGWSQGEHLSPEYMGTYATFSTTLMLRTGRYEIKFLVDGEWHLSPEFAIVGEDLMQNNLLIVK